MQLADYATWFQFLILAILLPWTPPGWCQPCSGMTHTQEVLAFGNGNGITSYQVAVLELEELLCTLILVDRVVVGNDAFSVLDGLGMTVSIK